MYILPPLLTNTGFVTYFRANLCDSLRVVYVTLLSVQVTDTKSLLDLRKDTSVLQLIQVFLKYLQIHRCMDIQ